jgi:hypothetical protein
MAPAATGSTPAPAAPNGRIAIATPVSRRPSPDQSAAELEGAAKRLLAAVGRDTPAARGWTPYSDGDSNTSIKGPAGTNVKLGDVLAEALAPLGYARVETLTYRAEWSTRDVEHVLRFDTYGNPKEFLTADAGLRNSEGEAFAKQCKERYANPAFRQATSQDGYWNSPWFCLMHFSVGGLLRWGPRGSVNLAGLTPDQIGEAIVPGIRSTLMPLVSEILTKASLLAFLERDEEPLRWVMRGPYYRAALVAYLATVLGQPRNQTRDLLLEHALWIANGIDTSRITPEAYIEHVLDDAAAAVAQSAN